MSAKQVDLEASRILDPVTTEQLCQYKDSSGYTIFSTGETGTAHRVSHWMLDHDRSDQGYRFLRNWLNQRSGTGSEWIHLQWHMAIFELELGYWDTAFKRFLEHILPVASLTEDALTDAPALLWRLSFASREDVELPWEPVRLTALARIQRPSKPYVELHNLLALSGAGDLDSLDRWIQRQPANNSSLGAELVGRMAVALRAYTAGDYQQASSALANVVPYISQVGGSRAQNQLFKLLEQASQRKTNAQESLSYLKAA